MNGSAVPFVRLDNADPALFEQLLGSVERVARGAAFILGEEVESFEDEFASYCETSFAVGVGSGTDALRISLQALGIGPGDEVVIPANTFVATAEAVSGVGATPRFVDVDPKTHLLTAEIVESAIGPRTRCVIPVHLYGRTVEMGPLMELARAARLVVVEDACQAHGARYHGRRVGTFGDCGCFSFYPAKNLGGWGDGGAAVTADEEIARRMRLLRSHGEDPKYFHRVRGSTARLDAIQAAILRVKLRRLDQWNDARRDLGAALTTALAGSGVEPPARGALGTDHVFHLYVIETDDRDGLRAELASAGVATGIHYPIPLHRSEAYEDLRIEPGALPIVERLAGRICSLPIFPGMTADEVASVAAAVNEFAGVGDEAVAA